MGQGEMFWWLCNENCGILLPFFFYFTLSWSVTNVCHGTTSRVKIRWSGTEGGGGWGIGRNNSVLQPSLPGWKQDSMEM